MFRSRAGPGFSGLGLIPADRRSYRPRVSFQGIGCPRVGEPLEVETFLEPSAPVSPESHRRRLPNWATVCEAAVFLVFVIFFLLYGTTPIFGGDGLGLVGADEPRYAEIAPEMLDR